MEKKWKNLPFWDQTHIVIYEIITIKLKKQTALNAPKGNKDTKSNSTWKWNQTNKNKLDVNNLRENHKEFIKKQKFNITILVKI